MIKIIIADDQMLTREGLRTILNLEDDIDVVGVARNGLEAVEITELLQPDLVLMDIQMPQMNGIEALKKIKQLAPKTNILILTTFLEDQYIIDGMVNGASGYLLKDIETDKMIQAIKDTINGQFILPASVASKLALRISDIAQSNQEKKSTKLELTEREREIAHLIVKGLNNKEISAQLHIAEGTVRNYISNLYSKLEVVHRVQAIIKLQQILGE